MNSHDLRFRTAASPPYLGVHGTGSRPKEVRQRPGRTRAGAGEKLPVVRRLSDGVEVAVRGTCGHGPWPQAEHPGSGSRREGGSYEPHATDCDGVVLEEVGGGQSHCRGTFPLDSFLLDLQNS